MRTTYRLEVVCRCPSDDCCDRYVVTINASRMILVEDIQAAVKALPERAYQEDLTDRLARALAAEVTTEATHYGVQTTCFCS